MRRSGTRATVPGFLPAFLPSKGDVVLRFESAPAHTPGQIFSRSDLLRWLYLARLTLVTGILAGALLAWFAARPQDTLVVIVMFLAAYAVTAGSFWYSHVLGQDVGANFLYAQVVLDVMLVTGVIHVTGGPDSSFAPLFILVISAGALLLPLPGGVLIGALASVSYFADLVWAYEGVLHRAVALQIGLFTLVALATGLLGDRLRRAGQALGAVESELRQLRLDTGDILANLATGVITVDSFGRLAYANPAAETLLALPAVEWMGRRVVDALDERAPGLGGLISAALQDRVEVDRFRADFAYGDRSARLGVSTAVLDRGGGVAPSATAIFQDITDLEMIEALNRRSERLEAVASLSASLAHEIKNPLASIRSAVEQLTRPEMAVEDRATLQRLVLNESDRLSRLLSEFLEYSGVGLGTREPVDLAGVVRDAVALVRQHPDAEGVTIACRGLDRPARVMGDADLLHRAVFNLVLNAVQFSGSGTTVRLAVEDLAREPAPRGTDIKDPVALSVEDAGPGVAHEFRDRIFDPFFTTRHGGSGLGLAVVHRAVDAHEGAIVVEDAPGGGARFVLVLPALGALPLKEKNA